MRSIAITGTLLALLLTACVALSPAAPSSLQSMPATLPVAFAATPALLIFPTPIPELPAASASPRGTTATLVNSPTPVVVLTQAATAVETHTLPTPQLSLPTLEPRLPAEKWQQWPVIPALTARARQIYARGRQLGTDPHAFAKIGDCQSVNVAFFGIYDQPKIYRLPAGYESLQETIDWFHGFFNRDSAAVRGGFNVASVFVPLQADPTICRSSETPLACEFRITNPSIAMISMETGFEGRTTAVYEKYMRQIIEYAIQRGALPILSTKADNFEGDQSINLTTARLAVEYDLPLWNFWRAVQPLPDHGMDAERKDNFHISVEAWNVRSFTGLQALDAIWRAVRN